MAVSLYFVLVRPQLRRASEHQAFVASLKVGDRVVTCGGLIGRLVRCSEFIVTLSFGGEVTIDALRAMVHRFAPAEDLLIM